MPIRNELPDANHHVTGPWYAAYSASAATFVPRKNSRRFLIDFPACALRGSIAAPASRTGRHPQIMDSADANIGRFLLFAAGVSSLDEASLYLKSLPAQGLATFDQALNGIADPIEHAGVVLIQRIGFLRCW